MEVFLNNEEWDLYSINVSRQIDYFNYGHFAQLVYSFSIGRKPFFYVVNQVVPTVILTLTALIGYHMPSAGSGVHQEKVRM